MNPPDFATWRIENLVKFATAAYAHMVEQQTEIDRLKLALLEVLGAKA